MSESWVKRFEDAATLPLSEVGGKGLNLVRLVQAGLPVPPGFIITTEAYAARRQSGDALLREILSAYLRLGQGRVAVRSSATAEDLKDASFAGQQATYLNVEGEHALLEGLRACWASLFSERAVAYRRSLGILGDSVGMAVVVQRMVDAEVAGVLFTADPTDAAGERLLIEGAWGLGEAVVSGRLTPDRWTLNRVTGAVLSRVVVDKPVQLTRSGEERVPDGRCSAPCLTDDEVQRLFEIGLEVERVFGAPQDLEWAIADGALSVLQSRTITTTAADRERIRQREIARLRHRAEPAGTVWARYSLAEVLPEPLPLSWELWKQFMSGGGGYGRMYRELGYDPDPMLDEDGILDLIAGRPYFNLSRDARLYFRDYPFDYPYEKLKADPDLAIYPTPETNLSRAPRGFLLKLPGITRKMLAAEHTLERAAEELPTRLEATVYPRLASLAEEWMQTDLRGFGDAELVRIFNELRRAVLDEFASQSLKPGVLAGLALQKLEGELRAALGLEARAAAERLIAGVRPPAQYDLAGALGRLQSGEMGRDEFLHFFGHRGPGEMELANPRWREDPTGLPTLGVTVRDTLEECRPNLNECVAGKPVNVARAERYLERARQFTALRETSKHFLMLGYEVLRKVLLEIDRRFRLRSGVFYLEPAELLLLTQDLDLSERIAVRRRERRLALSLETPRVLFSDDLEALGRPVIPAAEACVLEAKGVSPGSAEGEALVLRRPEDADAGATGFILVCPSTDPGWTPLFLRARGVVLETGGVLSHGAIVARELGLPAVANVAEACSRLRTGQRIRVDGSLGRVQLLE